MYRYVLNKLSLPKAGSDLLPKAGPDLLPKAGSDLLPKAGQFSKINMYKNNTYIGNSIFSIVNNKKSIIQNIFIKDQFRGNKIGSILLRETENIIKINYQDIQEYNLLAYELPNSYLLEFYKSNGYNIDYSHPNKYYDDGLDIYNLVYMYKHINDLHP
jgi:ribosomal protein S18 acetylase RimI-like enzyme